MLRDIGTIKSEANLSVSKNHSVSVLLAFIDKTISGFRPYHFSASYPAVDENAITFNLTVYFNAVLNDEQEGFLPYKFSFVKNPPQQYSRKETDLGVVILNKSIVSAPIIEFEAKRFSSSSNNSEYVYGIRGGIERFKKSEHGAHLSICGMFAYIQNASSPDWFIKVNEWIDEQSRKTLADLDWSDNKERLWYVTSFGRVNKYLSISKRLRLDSLTIHHYFIDLMP